MRNKLIFFILILTSWCSFAQAQDSIYEGRPVYDARSLSLKWMVSGPSFTGGLQDPTATFTFTRKLSAPTQQEADRKLAAYLAAWAESKGKSGLCVVVNGSCLEQNGQVVYDLEKVTMAVEEILEGEISAAMKARFVEPRLKAAQAQASADFENEVKPDKGAVKPASRPIVPSRRFRRR